MTPEGGRVFGGRLRELREQAGLTQLQLAERAGLHRQSIAKLELGERRPAWPTLLALAKGLGVSVESFAAAPQGPAGEGKPRPRGRPPKRKPAAPAPPSAEDLQGQAVEPKGPLKGLGKGKGGGEALGGGLPAEKPRRKGRGKGK